MGSSQWEAEVRNLAWLSVTLMVIAGAAALNRPLAESSTVPAKKATRDRQSRSSAPVPVPAPPVGFCYKGPLLGKWACVICTTPLRRTYRADGIVEYEWSFGNPVFYATYEVDDTHYPPVLITTERKGGRVFIDYCIWKITAEGKLRTESFKPPQPIPISFSKNPDPLLLSRQGPNGTLVVY